MTKWYPAIFAIIIMFSLLIPVSNTGKINQALACGWGTSGGGDFTPKAQLNSPSKNTSGKLLTKDQAFRIMSNHLAVLNPKLKVGASQDAGSHYRFEVKINNKNVEYLAVDKVTGLIRPIN